VRGVLAGLAGRKAGLTRLGLLAMAKRAWLGAGPCSLGLDRRPRMWRILMGPAFLRAAAKRPGENGVDGCSLPCSGCWVGAGLGGIGLWGVGLWGATPNPGEKVSAGPLQLAGPTQASKRERAGLRRGKVLQWLGTPALASMTCSTLVLPCRFRGPEPPPGQRPGLQAWGQVDVRFG